MKTANKVGAGVVRGAVPGALAMFLVGSSVAVNSLLRDVPLFAGQAGRYALAAAVLCGFAKLCGQRLVVPRGAEWLWVLLGALSGLVLFNVALLAGTAHADPAVLGAAVACVPILLAIVGPVLKRQPPRRRVVLAAVVVSAGAVIVNGGGRSDVVGILLAVSMLVGEAGFTLLGTPALPRMGAWSYSLATAVVATVAFGLLALVTEGGRLGELATAEHLAAVAYLGVVATAVAFVLWFTSVERIGAGVAGLMSGIAAPAAALLGAALGRPMPGLGAWIGMVIIGLGLAVGFVDRPGRRRVEPDPRDENESDSTVLIAR
ncbi:DMT family transporter [Amycolatopsis anabasis]|uniref:DMT family transporter n=1 Tax=Amycolatopsis anabasis TaxID=1840409 RepID=UPI001C5538E2|nr:DMT family transporter [Amycolatopsis anabasis]